MYEDGVGGCTGKAESTGCTTAIRVSLKSTPLSLLIGENNIIYVVYVPASVTPSSSTSPSPSDRFHSMKSYYQSVCECERHASERNTALRTDLSSLRHRLRLAKENTSNHLTRFTSLKVCTCDIFNTPPEFVLNCAIICVVIYADNNVFFFFSSATMKRMWHQLTLSG